MNTSLIIAIIQVYVSLLMFREETYDIVKADLKIIFSSVGFILHTDKLSRLVSLCQHSDVLF